MALKNGAFYNPAAIELYEPEVQESLPRALKLLKERGYSGLKDIELPESFALNGHMPQEAVHKAFVKRVEEAAPEADEEGTDIKLNQALTDLIKGYICSTDGFSYQEIRDYLNDQSLQERDLVRICQRCALQITEEQFVKHGNIAFDIEAIDSVLLMLYGDKPFTLRSFSSFQLLPPISDHIWNHFLLQSYLLHHSKQFTFSRLAANNRLIGIACLKKIAFQDYYELVAHTLKAYNIRLQNHQLHQYVVQAGFFGRMQKGTLAKVSHYLNAM